MKRAPSLYVLRICGEPHSVPFFRELLAANASGSGISIRSDQLIRTYAPPFQSHSSLFVSARETDAGSCLRLSLLAITIAVERAWPRRYSRQFPISAIRTCYRVQDSSLAKMLRFFDIQIHPLYPRSEKPQSVSHLSL